ncbi:monovalent cation/H+ antiporter subunit A [Bartonella sp. DGB2]|uniref:monovalent cation/H+ antiporter subunit A n=1 Tax=Bartonella sp. DGB2 TaxID=3388426 RepID=UPI00399010D2
MNAWGTMLVFLILSPFFGSALIGFFRPTAQNKEAWFAGAIALFGFLLTLLLYPAINKGQVVRFSIEWLPQWGLTFSFRMDGLSWLFALLITGIGLLVVIYARYYMDPSDPVPRFFSFFLAFMGAMLGIVLAGNLVLIVVFWELTSIFSFLLIGYWYHNSGAREGARMALIITGLGGFSLLLGVILLGHIVGSYDIDRLLQAGSLIRAHPLYNVSLICLLVAAFTKSAQFPFHFWLPNAMTAPTPASAYLHSATMVKAGIFLMLRLWPVMGGTETWFWTIGLAGLSTLLLGAYFAMYQQDLKGLLAYSTISHLGLITTLISLGNPLAFVAAVFHLANHATFKASLFMAAGIIDHETGTRDMRKLRGLFHVMPITATLALVASGAMAGVPLLNGFISKEMFFAQAVETHVPSWLDTISPYIATLAGLFSVTYSVRFIHQVFFGSLASELPKTPHEPPRFMRLPIELLVFICLMVGIFPNLTIGPILKNAVLSVLGSATPAYDLAIWHGFDWPVVMSLIALFGGLLFYILRHRAFEKNNGNPAFLNAFKGKRIFDRLLITLSWRLARLGERTLSSRSLQTQLRWLLTLSLLIIGWLLWKRGGLNTGSQPASSIDLPFLIIWIIGGACAILTAVKAKFHRLASLILLSVTGLMTCATYIWLSAPDLALTQLLVEIVTTILLLLGLRWLPKRWLMDEPQRRPWSTYSRRFYDFILALAIGGSLAFLSYAAMTRPPKATISNYFLSHAYEKGGGSNVVNVLLVDFRGFDTLGEGVVLILVALSVFALLRRFRPAIETMGAPNQQKLQTAFDKAQPEREAGDTLINYLWIPATIFHWFFPLITAFAFYLFLRGHDSPGGGFAAGVSLTIGFILQYLVSSIKWTEGRLRVLPLRWIGFGLLFSLLTGALAWPFGFPFLTSYSRYLSFAPLEKIGFEKIPLASALAFDLGIFALVLGALVLILIALAHQSIRHYRLYKQQDATALEKKEN